MSTATLPEVTTGLYYGGSAHTTEKTLPIADPAKPGVVVGHAAAATKQDVSAAIAAAKKAFPAWSALTPQQRAEQMAAAIKNQAEFRDADAAILSQENGKIVFEAWVDSLVLELRWNLALMLADEVNQGKVLGRVPHIPTETTVTFKPMGVVTIIVPFNWPIAILGASLPHALLAGNTVIVKPPLTAPLATARAVQRIAEQLPPGVLNVITGKDEDMSDLIQSEDVAKLCFTGSVNGGKRMQEMASKSLTRVTLELGGNDAAIFLDDAEINDLHLDRLFAAIFDTTGQICMNAKRVYVHRSKFDAVVAGLSERAAKVKLGYGLAEGTTHGPLHSPVQKAFVDEIIQEDKLAGADVREFSEIPGGELAGGNFVRPTIVVNPDPNLRVVTQEQFGPVIPVIPFDTDEEAIAAANNTWSGLCGSVWSSNPEHARSVGSRIQAGYIWVNDHGATRLDLRAPFGGVKQSGIGREQGIEGIRAFQETHSISFLDEAQVAAEAH